MTNWLPILLAILAGVLTPTQGAINNKLTQFVGNPILSSFISFIVGSIALGICLLFTKNPFALFYQTKDAPLIAWTGGISGAIFITALILAIPRIGVTMTFSLAILGQMLITLPIDHFGFLGTPVREINIQRIIGVLLVIIGVIVIRKY